MNRGRFVAMLLTIVLYEAIKQQARSWNQVVLMTEAHNFPVMNTPLLNPSSEALSPKQLQSSAGHNNASMVASPSASTETTTITSSSAVATKGNRSDSHDYGSWLANQWIPPPGWRLFTPLEMKHFFQRQRSVLFIGDSLGRRFMATLYAIINATDANDIRDSDISHQDVIDVNKFPQSMENCSHWLNHSLLAPTARFPVSICRNIPGSTSPNSHWDYLQLTCHHDLKALIKQDAKNDFIISRQYSLIVILMGAWEIAPKTNRKYCQAGGGGRAQTGTFNRLSQLLPLLPHWASNQTRVVWRTNGHHGKLFNSDLNLQMNQIVRDAFDVWKNSTYNVSLVDFAHGIWPRSAYADRIAGDNEFHYGTEARLMLAQMMMNVLLQDANPQHR